MCGKSFYPDGLLMVSQDSGGSQTPLFRTRPGGLGGQVRTSEDKEKETKPNAR